MNKIEKKQVVEDTYLKTKNLGKEGNYTSSDSKSFLK